MKNNKYPIGNYFFGKNDGSFEVVHFPNVINQFENGKKIHLLQHK